MFGVIGGGGVLCWVMVGVDILGWVMEISSSRVATMIFAFYEFKYHPIAQVVSVVFAFNPDYCQLATTWSLNWVFIFPPTTQRPFNNELIRDTCTRKQRSSES